MPLISTMTAGRTSRDANLRARTHASAYEGRVLRIPKSLLVVKIGGASILHETPRGLLARGSLESAEAAEEGIGVDEIRVGVSVGVGTLAAVEHLPARERRELLATMRRTTASQGVVALTVDVARGTTTLWNRNQGTQVEAPSDHGTVDDLLAEAADAGFQVETSDVIRSAGHRDVDVGWVVLAATSRN